MLQKWEFTLWGTVLTLITAPAAFWSAGFGHGNYILAFALHPLTFGAGRLMAGLFPGEEIVFMGLLLIQNPLYGLALDVMKRRGLLGQTAWALVTLHVSCSALLFWLRP
jgi:hypothetical protein